MKWYAIYTKPRHESPVATRLRDIGIETLNPQLKSKQFRRSRITEVVEPLFPCYLFARFRKVQYSHLIKYTRGVRYILGNEDPVAVHDNIIDAIKDRMDRSDSIDINKHNFETGEKVIIRGGPFRDFHGIFESNIKGSERVMILLDTIYYRLELDSRLLSKA